jgi:hypothetical protein
MDHTVPATTTWFEHALGIGIGIFDAVTETAPTSEEKPKRRTKERSPSGTKPKKRKYRRDN